MKSKSFFSFALSSVACLALGFYCGSNYKNWLYFNDDDEVREKIYHDAIESLVLREHARDGFEPRKYLKALHPDFFRSKEIECVRFMPEHGVYAFVKVFCRNLDDGTSKISYY